MTYVRSLGAVLLCALLLVACGNSAKTQQEAQSLKSNKDVQLLQAKAKTCLHAQGGLYSLKSKSGRHRWIACVAPPGKKQAAEQCGSKNLRLSFRKKKLEKEFMATLDCIARL